MRLVACEMRKARGSAASARWDRKSLHKIALAVILSVIERSGKEMRATGSCRSVRASEGQVASLSSSPILGLRCEAIVHASTLNILHAKHCDEGERGKEKRAVLLCHLVNEHS